MTLTSSPTVRMNLAPELYCRSGRRLWHVGMVAVTLFVTVVLHRVWYVRGKVPGHLVT